MTLLVNPDDAEALTLANNEGHIQLVLRNSADHGVSSTRGRQLNQIFGIPHPETAAASVRTPPVRAAKERPVAASSAAVTPIPEQIVMIRGKAKTVEIFEREGRR